MQHHKIVQAVMIGCLLNMAMPYIIFADTISEVNYVVKFSSIHLQFKRLNRYDVVRMEGAGMMVQLGKPMLPVKHIKIALPPGSRAVSVEARSLDSGEIHGDFFVMPGQPPLPVGQKNSESPVKPDPAVYKSNTLYPGELATLDYQGNLAGQQIVSVSVYPVHYVPAQRKLQLHTSIELIVHCTPDNILENTFQEQYYRFTENQRRLYEDMLKAMVVNPERVRIDPLESGPSLLVPTGQYDHVIITSSTLASYFDSLVYWHTKKGIKDTVVTTNWIYANYSGTDDTTKVREFIIDANSNWGTMYFLMGGEGTSVPYAERHYYGDTVDQIAPGDQYYSDFDDDWVHEVYVGRVSGDNETQITRFIDKVLKYEKDPPLADYPLKVLLIGMDLDDDTPAELLKDSIATFIPGHFTINKVYDSHGGNHEDSVEYYLGAGHNLVNHMDHSNKTVMGAGYHHHDWLINRTDIDNLTNDNKMSIITSGGCEPGAFDYDDCIGEHFIIYNDLQAGVAFIGNSRHGWYYGGDPYSLSSELDLWFWHGVFTQGKDDLGEALVYAKHQFPHTDNDWDKACEWNVNLLGEPAMQIWTDTPATMVVTHDSVVSDAPHDFIVTVMDADSITPVESALVCCWIPDQDPEMHVIEYTNASGSVALNVSATTPDDTMFVTVTKNNYLPYEGHATVISVVPPLAPYVTQATQLSSDLELGWNQVMTDTLGRPETVDYYVVHRSTVPQFIPGASDSIGIVFHPETTYTDTGVLDSSQTYYYLVKAVDEAGNKSRKSNMVYKLDRTLVDNSPTATNRNWVSLPYKSGYATVSDLVAGLSSSGDPVTKVTQLRDDQLYESYRYVTFPFPHWEGIDFAITPGRSYEMVTKDGAVDPLLVLVGSNEPDSVVHLIGNVAGTNRNWVSIPYNAVYSTVSDITGESFTDGDPVTKITNLRDDQLYESYRYVTFPFPHWEGIDFAIISGRGYEFVTKDGVTDTIWDPTEWSNEAGRALFVRGKVSQPDIETRLGALTEPDRAPVWLVQDALREAAHQGLKKKIDHAAAEVYLPFERPFMRQADYREPGISHIVCAHVRLPEREHFVFTAYRPDHPLDVLTENVVGCGSASTDDYGWLWFDVGNFKRPWQDGEEIVLIIEVLEQGRGYFAVVDFTLDSRVDIQELGEISLSSIPEPVVKKRVVRWDGVDNDNIVGYSLYHGGERLNHRVITEHEYVAQGGIYLRPVMRGGYETVYGSRQDSQAISDTHVPMSYAFTIFPNPFVTQTHIEYAVPKKTPVEMKIYDVSGRIVKTLVNAVHKPGYYTVVWHGSDERERSVSSGVYFIRCEAGGFRTHTKILLVK